MNLQMAADAAFEFFGTPETKLASPYPAYELGMIFCNWQTFIHTEFGGVDKCSTMLAANCPRSRAPLSACLLPKMTRL